MPLVGAAAVTGVAALGGAAVQNSSQNRATRAQERAAQDALAYAREQDATRQAQYKEQLAAWEQQRDALYKHYGVDVPGRSLYAGKSARPESGGGAAMPVDVPQKSLTLGDLVRQGNAASPGGQPGGEMVPEGAQWNDWRNYIPTR